MSEQQLGQHLQEVRVVFNPSYSAGLMALSEEWGISPVAVARRIVREVLRDRGVLDHPPRSSSNRDSRPGMVHRTLRITPMQASFLDSTAFRHGLSRSEMVRGVLSHATRHPFSREHLHRVPSDRRTVRWSIRITRRHYAHIRRVAEMLCCSETDAAAALLASTTARRHFLQHLNNRIS